jgi:hypothetical protein
MHLGMGLHALQDIYAHGNIGVGSPIADHAVFGRLPFWKKLWKADEIDYNWKDDKKNSLIKTDTYMRHDETKMRTIEYLNDFADATKDYLGDFLTTGKLPQVHPLY